MAYLSHLRDPANGPVVRIETNYRVYNGSQLTVPGGTKAFFYLNGVRVAEYGPGKYTLYTGETPWLVHFRHLMTRGDPCLTVQIFYIATEMESHLRLGSGAIWFRSKRYQLDMTARADLSIDYRISDPLRFLEKLVGEHSQTFCMEDIQPRLEDMLRRPVKEELSACFTETDIRTLNTQLTSIGVSVLQSVRNEFRDDGIDLTKLSINSINVDENDLNALRSLEQLEAEERVKTDMEHYNVEQIYGDVDRRTIARAFTNNGSLFSALLQFELAREMFRENGTGNNSPENGSGRGLPPIQRHE